MSVTRLACLAFVVLWPIASPAQLVVKERQSLVPNPAADVPYPGGGAARNCNNTIADTSARAVLRAIDSCPVELYEHRDEYYGYAQKAVLGLLVPGATEAAVALALDKAAENTFFCLTNALIDESGASDGDKEFLKSLVEEVKEVKDRVEFAGKLGELKEALRAKGFNAINDAGVQTFVNTLDVAIDERLDGLGKEAELVGAGQARYTPESRARDLTEAARSLGRECRFAEAEAGLAKAQQANLAFLADLRVEVANAQHRLVCLERLRPKTVLDQPSRYLPRDLDVARADAEAAVRRDEEMTALIGQLAELQESYRARRGDIEFFTKRATKQLETARQAAGNCEWTRAAGELDQINKETLECALELDAKRKERDELAAMIEEAKKRLPALESAYQIAINTPFGEVGGCGQYSVFADTIDELRGECRTIIGVDAKVAALRARSRECADFVTSTKIAGALVGKVDVSPEKLEQHGGGSYTRSTYGANRHTWERDDKGYPFTVKFVWNYTGVPAMLEPGKEYTITVTGETTDSPKGAADGFVLSGNVAVYGDVTMKVEQSAHRGNPQGRYVFVVHPNARNVEIHLGGAPMGTGAIWKYTKPK